MATQVIYSPTETAKLCSKCHDSINFIKPNPEIPVPAKATMMALQRADAVINWSRLLLAEGQRLNLSVRGEMNEFKTAKDNLSEAGVKLHMFNLENVRKQADEVYLKGAKVKDGLRKRLTAE
jgi:hypothetical protein